MFFPTLLSAFQWPDFLKTWDKGGPFVAGILVGCAVSYLMFRLASGERKERMKLDEKRDKQMSEQLLLKEKRIDELHDTVRKLLNDKDESLSKKKK